MIREENRKGALTALHDMLVCLRTMAYEKASHEEMARILDAMEELPTLFEQRDDMTDYFRGVLADVAQRHKAFGIALASFDNNRSQ
jgi:hypothetical protein